MFYAGHGGRPVADEPALGGEREPVVRAVMLPAMTRMGLGAPPMPSAEARAEARAAPNGPESTDSHGVPAAAAARASVARWAGVTASQTSRPGRFRPARWLSF